MSGFETTFFVTMRESLEAFLILSILTGLVVKLGRPEAKRPLLWGALVAFVASVVVGAFVHLFVLDLYERSGYGEYVGAGATIIAVAILTYMVVWMYQHTLGLLDELRQRAKGALEHGRPAVFFTLAFVAVGREGLETVLIVASQSASTGGLVLLLAVLFGILVSAVAAWLLFSGIVRLSLKRFFAASGVLLIFFAAGLLATSVHELAEAGLVPTVRTAWDSGWLVGQSSTVGRILNAVFGYRSKPTLLEAAAYFAYLATIGVWYVRGLVRVGRAGGAKPASA